MESSECEIYNNIKKTVDGVAIIFDELFVDVIFLEAQLQSYCIGHSQKKIYFLLHRSQLIIDWPKNIYNTKKHTHLLIGKKYIIFQAKYA